MKQKGNSTLKTILQAPFHALGYKVVRRKPYEKINKSGKRPSKGYDKVFCIGFNKTGTTSLERVLRELAFRMPKQIDQERILKRVIQGKDYDRLKHFICDFDAFQDLPFSQFHTYIVCDALFPNSRFILTLRDPNSWVESFVGYYRKAFSAGSEFNESTLLGKNVYLEKDYAHRLVQRTLQEFGDAKDDFDWAVFFDRDRLLDLYQRRNAEVMAYFHNRPDDLLILDPTTEPDTNRLLSFLELHSGDAQAFPRLNSRAPAMVAGT